MITLLVLVIVGFVAYIIKSLVEINAIVLQINKNATVHNVPNTLEQRYQFIKGLY
jgi:hypothetical protein